MWCWGGDDYGLPPGPSRERRATSAARPPAYRLHIAYVTPSRRATRTASPNSPSACACHLDVVTLRRFTPATGWPRWCGSFCISGNFCGNLPGLAGNAESSGGKLASPAPFSCLRLGPAKKFRKFFRKLDDHSNSRARVGLFTSTHVKSSDSLLGLVCSLGSGRA